jgi:RNA polymerase sigma-70 factor (ECF subfamily)
MNDARSIVEAVARSSYGQLVAYLSARTRDVAGAEDALGEALLEALATWPRDGVPAKPEAWLFAAARNRLIDAQRGARVREEHAEALHAAVLERASEPEPDEIPDQRVELLFVCAHPALDADVHTPLMLQSVLGVDASRIAQAFLVSPAAMRQRLVRAKRKIRETGMDFELPRAEELERRLEAVLEAIYAAYGLAWDEVAGGDAAAHELGSEAVWLARVLLRRMPDNPEVRGLLALLLFCDSRRATRRDADRRYVPLSEQDPAAWDHAEIDEAEKHLHAAAAAGRAGRFQLEAAIQSVHAERRASGRTDWAAIALFYEHLVALAPSLGARIALAVALAEAHGAATGLERLDELAHDEIASFQPYWAARAHLLRLLGDARAAAALDRAIGLTQDPAARDFLLARRERS